nr:hypothetical protein Iba_chr02dCG7650 [Ipomoea batatas]
MMKTSGVIFKMLLKQQLWIFQSRKSETSNPRHLLHNFLSNLDRLSPSR